MNDLLSSRNHASRTAGARGGKLLSVLLAALVATLAMLAITGTASAAIPASFFTIVDQQGVNDVNSDQVDLTQMGRDDSDAAMYKLFWSWDSTSQWTGEGQTGDACALFDSDGDGDVNFAVCARIENPNADPTQAKLTADSPFLFSCTDARNDRCSQPTLLVAAGITAGTIGSGGTDRNGNLITDTDPFAPAGSDSPNDVTLQVNIPKILLTGGVLVNVCSYPSAGNGGNNNPFDCIANPGGGFLVIVKNAGNDTTTSFPFAVSPVPTGTAANYTIVGSGETDPISLIVGSATETVTETVPAGWKLTGASCTLSGNPTGTFDSANNRVTGISIGSGLETRCTFVDVKDNPALSLVKTASPQTYSAAGQIISYSYLVTNSGNVPLAGPVTVTDDKATVTCPAVSTVGNLNGTLDPGESITCTASYTITQADLNSGSVTNIATAHAGGTDSNQDTETVTAVQAPALTLVKTATPQTYDSVGDVISYSYLVSNSGNVSLAGPVTVTDDKSTDEACPAVTTVGNLDGNLDPGESITCTASYTITQADLNSGSVTNVATAHAGGTDSNQDTETVTAVQDRELTLVKSATPATYSTVGAVISYSYLVSNSGNVSLAGPVTITDDKSTDEACPAVTTVGNLDGNLDPGESITCTASYTITQADLNSGSVTNIATAHAGGTDSNQDTETVTAVQAPALTLVKTATPQTYDSVGDVISYSYLVSNSGNVSLAGPVTVTDDKSTDEACPAVTTVGNLDGNLDPGESITCTASYTITQADLNSGSVTNVATAHAGGTDSNQDTETVTAVQGPALTLVKTASPQTYDSVGDVISYSFLVSNSGNVSLAGPVTITDDKTTNETCPAVTTVGNLNGSLDPGESITCTASYTITQADLNSGSVTNIATAHAGGTDSNQDTETVTAVQDRELTLDKTASPQTYDSVGDVISYSYLVTNSGNVSLAGPVTVADNKATVTCPNVDTVGNNDANLDPNESITCTASYTITQADLNNGSVTNVAKASAGQIDSNEDTETVDADQNRELTLDKTALPQTYDSVGDVISYSYLVTNSGNVRLAGPVTVADNKATVSCPAVDTVGNNDTFLDPGEAVTCTATYVITQADLNNGSVTNVAKASAGQIDSNEDTETVDADQNRELSLDKTASPPTYDSVGDVISYSYLVTNSGNVRLAGPVTVADNKATVSCPAVDTVGNNDSFLDPSEAVTCTASYTITQADLNNGSVTNVARASAGEVLSPEDEATVEAVQTRTVLLDKTASPLSADSVGDVIAYSYLVTNTGNVRLAGPVTVADDKATVTCPAVSTVGNNDGFLDPGEAVTCAATYTITQADLNNRSVTNTAQATVGGTDSNQDKVTVTVTPPATPPPPPPPPPVVIPAALAIDLSITKTDRPDPVFVGATLTYTLTVRNAGPDTATNVSVVDSLPGATRFVSVRSSQGVCTGGAVVRCSLGTLASGGAATVTIVVRPLEPGALINAATVVGAEPEANTANNRATTPTLVRGPFVPPTPATCPTLTVLTHTLSAGRKGTVRAVVSANGKGVAGVRVLVTGAGIRKAGITNRLGRVTITVRPPRAGIAEIRMTNQPGRCSTRRIGVAGVFAPPSVTG